MAVSEYFQSNSLISKILTNKRNNKHKVISDSEREPLICGLPSPPCFGLFLSAPSDVQILDLTHFPLLGGGLTLSDCPSFPFLQPLLVYWILLLNVYVCSSFHHLQQLQEQWTKP